ncbi:MAG: UPF0755 protein [Saprospiraceae bacterium]|jgi:UPF0755 protein|tara:strand:+ start:183 stop:1214 length:1032 start_codon:yes stop_codon:yes gene_type:complete
MMKKILYAILILGLVAGAVAYWGYHSVFTPNTSFLEKEYELKIPYESSYDDVYKLLKSNNVLDDAISFDKVADWMNYKKRNVASGRYIIKKDWNNREIVGLLRSGKQKPVKITFNNVRSMEQLAGLISKDLAVDSVTLSDYLAQSEVIEELGYAKETFMTTFIPNTYNMFWNVTPEQIVSRMVKEHKDFWSMKGRKAKAARLEMTEAEVYTLASIVEKESQHGPERPTIAGLYLNRLKGGIALQADPTVVFANGNYELRRVLNKHLKYDSPYNTYKYSGLPPGPIYMPSIQSIDAVLDYEKHDFLYMCAKPGYGTKHAFAKTLRGHNRNANEYRAWLNEQGIK